MTEAVVANPTWQAYWALCKPKVVALMLITAAVGMFMASPGWVPLTTLLAGLGGIGLVASAGAAVNHVLERELDSRMARTRKRPLPTGELSAVQAIGFAFLLLTLGTLMLMLWVNMLTAVMTLLTVLGYAVIYTVFLKPATPQNIVLGGLSGAMPPLLGWVAVSNQLDPGSLLLVLIIFTWTPPHFWALSIYRYEEYAQAKVPMLPVTHGITYTKLNILLYTVLLFAVSLLPFVVKMSGWLYLLGAVVLNSWFCKESWQLWRQDCRQKALEVFRYSIIYMFALFMVLLADHYLLLLLA